VAAVIYRSSTEAHSSAGVLTQARPSDVVEGDYMFWFIFGNYDEALALPTGWEYWGGSKTNATSGTTNLPITLLWRQAGASEAASYVADQRGTYTPPAGSTYYNNLYGVMVAYDDYGLYRASWGGTGSSTSTNPHTLSENLRQSGFRLAAEFGGGATYGISANADHQADDLLTMGYCQKQTGSGSATHSETWSGGAGEQDFDEADFDYIDSTPANNLTRRRSGIFTHQHQDRVDDTYVITRKTLTATTSAQPKYHAIATFCVQRDTSLPLEFPSTTVDESSPLKRRRYKVTARELPYEVRDRDFIGGILGS
jgi:NADH:ubiquinone oxidoreductase subunit